MFPGWYGVKFVCVSLVYFFLSLFILFFIHSFCDTVNVTRKIINLIKKKTRVMTTRRGRKKYNDESEETRKKENVLCSVEEEGKIMVTRKTQRKIYETRKNRKMMITKKKGKKIGEIR